MAPGSLCAAGHDNNFTQNILAYVGGCFGTPLPFRYFKGYNNAFVNNTCITVGEGAGAGPYSSDCYLDTSWTVGLNKVFTSTGAAEICGKPWDEWFETNTSRDVGSSIAAWPADAQLVAWAAALLNFSLS